MRWRNANSCSNSAESGTSPRARQDAGNKPLAGAARRGAARGNRGAYKQYRWLSRREAIVLRRRRATLMTFRTRQSRRRHHPSASGRRGANEHYQCWFFGGRFRNSLLLQPLSITFRRPSAGTSVLLIVGPKCTLAASHAAPGWVMDGEYADGTDRRTNARPLQLLLGVSFDQPTTQHALSHEHRTVSATETFLLPDPESERSATGTATRRHKLRTIQKHAEIVSL